MSESHIAKYRRIFGNVKSVNKNYTLPHTLVDELETYADSKGMTRSRVLALALVEFLIKQEPPAPKRTVLHVRVGSKDFNPTSEDLARIADLFKAEGDAAVVTSTAVVVDRLEIPEGPLDVRVFTNKEPQ